MHTKAETEYSKIIPLKILNLISIIIQGRQRQVQWQQWSTNLKDVDLRKLKQVEIAPLACPTTRQELYVHIMSCQSIFVGYI